jgi:pimeloyl-ACP methyl ester carboxylesterase
MSSEGDPIEQTREVRANGVTFSVLESGPADGPLALCLHGFPDTAHTWRLLLPALAGAGYHAVAPFLRAYAPTEIPADGRYQVGALARDANDLHQVLGGDSDAVLIGHDWGAIATYPAVTTCPDRWRAAVTMAVPPTPAMTMGFLTYDQLRRSWYIFFFQSPLAQLAIGSDDWVFFDRLWSDWSPGYDARADLAWVKQSIGTPERALAAMTYYRAMFDASLHDPELAPEQDAAILPCPRPVLYLHGRDDGCLGVDTIGDPLAWLGEGSAVTVIDDGGHFFHLEQPDAVAARVLSFLGQ